MLGKELRPWLGSSGFLALDRERLPMMDTAVCQESGRERRTRSGNSAYRESDNGLLRTARRLEFLG